jgi:hypothetical protein
MTPIYRSSVKSIEATSNRDQATTITRSVCPVSGFVAGIDRGPGARLLSWLSAIQIGRMRKRQLVTC